MYRFILFDLDGTLTDPKQGICESVRYALKKMGRKTPPVEELTCFIGPPLMDSFRDYCHMDEETAKKAVEYYRERFSVTGWKENEVYEGITELLAAAKKRGMRLAIASSKPTVFVEKILAHFKLKRYFDVVVGSELDGSRCKKEEVVEEALRRLYERYGKHMDVLKCREMTAMVGDRRFDIEGARAMGVDGIGVSYGYQEKGELATAGADAIAATVEELRELLLGGEDRGIRERRIERERKDGLILTEPVPDSAFLRPVYMLMPFVLSFLLQQALLILGTTVLEGLRRGSAQGQLWMADHSALLSVVVNSVVLAMTALFLYLFYRKKEPLHMLPLWEKKDFPKKLLLICLWGMVLSAALNYILTEAARLILPMIWDAEKTKAFFEAATYNRNTPLIAGILYYVGISPLLEELLFRWLLCGRIRRGFSENVTIVITALFFGCYHGNILQGIYAFLMGLVMGRLMLKEDGLLAPLLFHMSANAFIFLTSYFSVFS